MIDLKKEDDDAEDVEIWGWLLGLLERLGEDGMSSEESDIDMQTGMEVYYTRRMPWRRGVNREMKLIDDQRFKDKQVYTRKGTKPATRVRNGAKGDTRRFTPKGLPKSFYDKEWLTAQRKTDRRDLHISEEKFNWMVIH